MKEVLKEVRNYIKKLILAYRIKQAIKKAEDAHRKTRFHYLVLMANGRPVVYSRPYAKHLLEKKNFRKGVTIATLERQAIYSTK